MMSHHLNEAELITQFSTLSSWEQRYKQLIMLSRQLPALTTEQKAQAVAINGCENQVWLGYHKEGNQLTFYADSEGRIVKGLLAILLIATNHHTINELAQKNLFTLFEKLQLSQQLSPSRQQGLHAIINTMNDIIQQEAS